MKSDTALFSYRVIFIHHIIPKRVFDLLFSIFILVLFSPLFLIIALGILFSSKGPVIYKQRRIGRGGKIFDCYKFRTMHAGADTLLETILNNSPGLKKEWVENQKLKSDPRVFSFGNFLRKTSLDELPQFWNVLKGDLSVVGPRPYLESQGNDLGHKAYLILSIRPGITGLWQISGRSSTSFKKRIKLDARYVTLRSFIFDLLIIAKTIPSIFYSKNAF